MSSRSNKKPHVFIGSSTNGLAIADAIQKELEKIATTRVWSQGAFNPTKVPIENLFDALESADFAVFVFLHEDPGAMRDSEVLFVRDNVIFEAGLFVARLGRDRVYFVAPESPQSWIQKLHLPSDFAGLSPATFDARHGNLQSAVAPALYHLKQAIASFSDRKSGRVIFDSIEDRAQRQFIGNDSYIFEGDKVASPKSAATFSIGRDGTFHLQRANVDGRYEMMLRPAGPVAPSLPKVPEPQRTLLVSGEAKTDKGRHTIRLVWKNLASAQWAANQSLDIASQNWTEFEFEAQVPALVDLLFRIDDFNATEAPSSLFLRGLKITEIS